MLEKLLQWDRETFIFLNNLSTDRWDAFWTTVTAISSWIPLFLFLIVLLIWMHGQNKGLKMTFTILAMASFVLLLTKITKEWVGRQRPNNDETINELIRVLITPTDFSFFSGHAATSFSIAVLVYLFLRKKTAWIALLFLWAILFTISRIFVGVHYPIDIIVGALVGTISAILFFKLHNKLTTPYSR